ncbi:methyltransferase [Brevibacterium ravenspurgense]|uniref:methyltransferase n=1 Tax=Brevibacterium ravenspurgense TaxID=479117 RepID=UPI0007821282|nr:methyltransferase [Brevibacterium ravenspurgense]
MFCAHFAADRCRTCSLIEVPANQRLTRIERELAANIEHALGGRSPEEVFEAPITSPDSGFRNTAKMAVGGTTSEPTLGILDEDFAGIDLSDCPLYSPVIHRALEAIPAVIKAAQIPPYRVRARKGELKYVIVTEGDAGQLAIRFVLRTDSALPRLKEKLPRLLEAVPDIAVISANIHPEHTAIIEGPTEIHLYGEHSLPVTQGDVTLLPGPQSFLQTNSAVAGELYRTVRQWIADTAAAHPTAAAGPNSSAHPTAPLTVWDLYCGVGGFALHAALASPKVRVRAAELNPEAVQRAREAARRLVSEHPEVEGRIEFTAEDAFTWAREQTEPADLLIVNPPRRGLGKPMSQWIQNSEIATVIYSSCNPQTLAADLENMPAYRAETVRIVDMFPHSPHAEVLTRLKRL